MYEKTLLLPTHCRLVTSIIEFDASTPIFVSSISIFEWNLIFLDHFKLLPSVRNFDLPFNDFDFSPMTFCLLTFIRTTESVFPFHFLLYFISTISVFFSFWIMLNFLSIFFKQEQNTDLSLLIYSTTSSSYGTLTLNGLRPSQLLFTILSFH